MVHDITLLHPQQHDSMQALATQVMVAQNKPTLLFHVVS